MRGLWTSLPLLRFAVVVGPRSCPRDLDVKKRVREAERKRKRKTARPGGASSPMMRDGSAARPRKKSSTRVRPTRRRTARTSSSRIRNALPLPPLLPTRRSQARLACSPLPPNPNPGQKAPAMTGPENAAMEGVGDARAGTRPTLVRAHSGCEGAGGGSTSARRPLPPIRASRSCAIPTRIHPRSRRGNGRAPGALVAPRPSPTVQLRLFLRGRGRCYFLPPRHRRRESRDICRASRRVLYLVAASQNRTR